MGVYAAVAPCLLHTSRNGSSLASTMGATCSAGLPIARKCAQARATCASKASGVVYGGGGTVAAVELELGAAAASGAVAAATSVMVLMAL